MRCSVLACLDKGGVDGQLLDAVCEGPGRALRPRHGQLCGCQQELLPRQKGLNESST